MFNTVFKRCYNFVFWRSADTKITKCDFFGGVWWNMFPWTYLWNFFAQRAKMAKLYASKHGKSGKFWFCRFLPTPCYDVMSEHAVKRVCVVVQCDDRIVFFYYLNLSCFWKMVSVSDPNPILVEIILSVFENYPKVYYDAQHTFLCFVYFSSWGKITLELK